MVATEESFSCRGSVMDALRLSDEGAAGNGEREDSDEEKGKVGKVKPKEVDMTVDGGGQEADKTMEEEESKWVAGDGLDEEHEVETEEEETVKLDLALTNDEDMMKSYGEVFVKGDGLELEETKNQDARGEY